MTKIVVKIDCGGDMCLGCRFQRYEWAGIYCCDLFEKNLKIDKMSEENKRLSQCIKAEKELKTL